MHPELGGNMGAVEFDGAFVNAEVGGDLFVQLALDDMAEDLALAIRQLLERFQQLEAFLLLQENLLVVGKGAMDGGKEFFLRRVFGQEILGTSAHGFDGGGDVTLAGQENDRQQAAYFRHGLLEFNSVHAGHHQVGDHTTGHIASELREKFGGRIMNDDFESRRSQQA